MMKENKQDSSSHSTGYIKSNNRGNTFDNMQRSTKKEDPLNPGHTNPPPGNKEQQSTPDADAVKEDKE